MPNTPFIPDYIKEPRLFYDRRRGLMLLGKCNNSLYLFRHDPAVDEWVSQGKPSLEDVNMIEQTILNSSYP